jgi:hypothetical protein
MVKAKTQLLWSETRQDKQNLVKIEAYLKPSWVLVSTNKNLYFYKVICVITAVMAGIMLKENNTRPKANFLLSEYMEKGCSGDLLMLANKEGGPQ